MRTLCKLNVPRGMADGFRDVINVPATHDGIKMAEWWKHASVDASARVVRLGDETGDYVAAWKKVAAEIVESPTPKSQHDLESVIKRLEQANEDKGQTSAMSDPPVTNP